MIVPRALLSIVAKGAASNGLLRPWLCEVVVWWLEIIEK